MARDISNSDDVIDSRDVIARIEELEEIEAELKEAAEEDESSDGPTLEEAKTNLEDWQKSEESEELTTLRKLAETGEGSPDWKYGETLIRDSYFQRYAEELADDLGCIPDGAAWPLTCIDWEWAARELQHDYFSVEFGSITYWIRS